MLLRFQYSKRAHLLQDRAAKSRTPPLAGQPDCRRGTWQPDFLFSQIANEEGYKMKRANAFLAFVMIAGLSSNVEAADPQKVTGIKLRATRDRTAPYPSGSTWKRMVADPEYKFMYADGTTSTYRRTWGQGTATVGYIVESVGTLLGLLLNIESMDVCRQTINSATCTKRAMRVSNGWSNDVGIPINVILKAKNPSQSSSSDTSSVKATVEGITTLSHRGSYYQIRGQLGTVVATRRILTIPICTVAGCSSVKIPLDSISYSPPTS